MGHVCVKPLLSEEDVAQLLAATEGWRHEDAALVKDFRFTAAPIALAFIQRLGAAAERLNHHPNVEWFKREVRVTLSSRKSGGLTAQDAALARACDEAAI
ncbi:MAG: 4a-hydroxytetrahydrobiopterin dehydratase [Myxococcales bacterium]|nr:4a-hydroxytetrahydrobiopterin dehydratase [Myxococcales bacterium]